MSGRAGLPVLDRDHPPLPLARRILAPGGGEETGLCLVEGWKCLAEALALAPPLAVLLREGCREPEDAGLPAGRTWRLPESRLKGLFGTDTPEGVLAIFPRPETGRDWPAAVAGSLHLALLSWQDPANVGAAVRAALGLGAASVVLWGPGPDVFSPKVLRASMGAVFRLPLARVPVDAAPPPGWQVFHGHMEGADSLAVRPDPTKPGLLVIGPESAGLPEHMRRASTAVSIRLHGGLESLSAPVAAAVLLDRLRRGG